MDRDGLILLVDAGNTRVKFGWLQPGTGSREPAPLALEHIAVDRLPEWLTGLPAPLSRAVGVSVASAALMQQVDSVLGASSRVSVQWLRSAREAAGIINLYDQPAQLGPDRWLSLVGLAGHTTRAAVLATFGTATTVDTLSSATSAPARRFEGGIILPGPDLMRRSLVTGTAALPYAEGESEDFPRNTHAAISTGVAAAQAGAVLRQWRRAAEALGVAPQLYCAGGGWPLVANELTIALARAQSDCGFSLEPPIWLDAPVLDGLAALASQAGQPGVRSG